MDEVASFQSLCRPTEPADFKGLMRQVVTHLDSVEETGLSNEDVDVVLAQEVVARLRDLVAIAGELSDDQRGFVRGAVDYFLLTTDVDDDLHSPSGIEDDARVVNHVCDLLNRADLKVALHSRSSNS